MKSEATRQHIEELDKRLVELLNERVRLAAEADQAVGQPAALPVEEPKALDHLCRQNPGPLADRAIQLVYRELFNAARALGKPARVAYLEPETGFAHMAAAARFGANAELKAQPDIQATLAAVERELADYAVIPIEDSRTGFRNETLDALLTTNLKVCGEVGVPIGHHLLATCDREYIQLVYATSNVFNLCHKWLTEEGLSASAYPVSSELHAAAFARDEEHAATIGTTLLAEQYGLRVIQHDIDEPAEGTARHLVLGVEAAKPSGKDKTALLFNTADRPGALVDVLLSIREAGINLNFIHSHLDRRREWELNFFATLEGHISEEKISRAVDDAGRHCLGMRVLGSFPRAADTD